VNETIAPEVEWSTITIASARSPPATWFSSLDGFYATYFLSLDVSITSWWKQHFEKSVAFKRCCTLGAQDICFVILACITWKKFSKQNFVWQKFEFCKCTIPNFDFYTWHIWQNWTGNVL